MKPESKKEIAAPKKTIESWLTGAEFKKQVSLALPKHITPDRFVRVALTATSKKPELLQCDPHSFFSSLMTLSQLGLEPDGRLAHLIPFGKECQLIVDYKGLVDLALRTGKVDKVQAAAVCEADDFEFNLGEVTKHIVDFKKPRGQVYAYYAQVYLANGKKQGEVMTVKEVEDVRKRSRAATKGPWVTDFGEMAKKTVFRRLSKWVPLSPEYRDALEADADSLEEKRFAAASPATASAVKPDWERLETVPGPAEAEARIAEAAAQEVVDAERQILPPKSPSGRQRPAPAPPAVEPAGATSSARERLYAEIPDEASRADFLEGLRQINYPDLPETVEQLSELSQTLCANILRDGVEELWAKARAQAVGDERDELFPLDPRTHGIQPD